MPTKKDWEKELKNKSGQTVGYDALQKAKRVFPSSRPRLRLRALPKPRIAPPPQSLAPRVERVARRFGHEFKEGAKYFGRSVKGGAKTFYAGSKWLGKELGQKTEAYETKYAPKFRARGERITTSVMRGVAPQPQVVVVPSQQQPQTIIREQPHYAPQPQFAPQQQQPSQQEIHVHIHEQQPPTIERGRAQPPTTPFGQTAPIPEVAREAQRVQQMRQQYGQPIVYKPTAPPTVNDIFRSVQQQANQSVGYSRSSINKAMSDIFGAAQGRPTQQRMPPMRPTRMPKARKAKRARKK